MTNIQVIGKDEIRELIPHAGQMCLLEKVIEWDDNRIVCSGDTHQNSDNPLRNDQGLPITALIEYGAQAMAIHGGIMAKKENRKIQSGYIATLRNVSITSVADASRIKTSLRVEAIKKMSSGGNMIYTFTVDTDQQRLICGQATVISVSENQ